MSSVIPIPRIPITIRPGTIEDLPFMDALQKKHTKQVGFMPTKQFEGKIKLGHVLVAEESRGTGIGCRVSADGNALDPNPETRIPKPDPVGYLIGNDQYFKRDDCGIIYQINVVPEARRRLVGAILLKAQFDRSAYGCRLYCCWCAQDIEANHFWESLGFIPLAFRAGSRGKGRVHIFWQRRIRQGDRTTPYWFPSQTTSGSIREDRIVLPIPPGTHWKDAKPIVLPGENIIEAQAPKPKQLPGAKMQMKPPTTAFGRLQFAVPKPPAEKKAKREPRQKQKNDPRLIAAARELRDRWLEKVNDSGGMGDLSNGKYDLTSALAPAVEILPATPLPPKQLAA